MPRQARTGMDTPAKKAAVPYTMHHCQPHPSPSRLFVDYADFRWHCYRSRFYCPSSSLSLFSWSSLSLFFPRLPLVLVFVWNLLLLTKICFNNRICGRQENLCWELQQCSLPLLFALCVQGDFPTVFWRIFTAFVSLSLSLPRFTFNNHNAKYSTYNPKLRITFLRLPWQLSKFLIESEKPFQQNFQLDYIAKLSDAICNRNKFPMPQFTVFMQTNSCICTYFMQTEFTTKSQCRKL